ncbi:hypothetical protein KC19_VG056900 [Ceratodon purpureus]|uniref:Myosin motor domain-containing protein n=1 Tax=Ceratodon purpureus TaxID=3225 RepID=A0A8T0HMP8_CERPU|nr:hypothetical protein KC19_VG056900 [Ceratodon purpureus]
MQVLESESASITARRCAKIFVSTSLGFQLGDSRKSLAKAIYANLFDWLIERINKSLETGKKRTGRSISILDIYGFESLRF